MKTRIRLSKSTSARIRKFWDKHGTFTGAMLAQPVFNRRGRYTLRIKMFTPMQARRIDDLLLELGKSIK